MSTDEQHVGDSHEHEEELKQRNPDERSPEERRDEQPDESVTEEGILGSVPGARANKPTG
ncbi:hypothetical protein DVA67_017760 [Solirubrobacter sp. CPCC 204708]|uniref:Uncharacterized protein n=1 Tax=Solirubrobacter deserti TaxID=2282478 RepID=A0ABT4RDI2_9ACTN|nr:hypothetical protein [Solirubrobacter deserti]MBE2317833.1 hypothetical protein [Solirubrobacter deserti]MDA0136390.1 hypothetical protein [Solirubrobacter deserti]